MNIPLVSIMIPTYNQEQYIGRAIESALAQTYPNLEIVISDDASTDSTGRIAEKYSVDPRVKYYRQEKNIGRVGNYRQALFEKVSGEWVLNLDGDDYLLDKNYILEAMTAFENSDSESIVLICADRYESDELFEAGLSPENYEWKIYSGQKILLDYFTKSRPFRIWHLTSLYKRQMAIAADFYRYDITSSDQESIFRLILHGNILNTSRKVAVWQAHGSNASKVLDMQKTIENLWEYRHIRDYALENDFFAYRRISAWSRKSVCFTVRKYIKEYARDQGLGVGIRFYKKTCEIFPEAWSAPFNVKILGRILLNTIQRRKGK